MIDPAPGITIFDYARIIDINRAATGGLSINPHTGELLHGGCDGTWIFPPPYGSTDRLYDKSVPRP